MMLNSKSIGNKVAEARKTKNLSQAELANKISISPQAVGKWERGESMPDISTLNRLAEIFGVDLNYFSDSFQSITIEKQNDRQSIGLNIEQSKEEPKKRFDWNWDMSNGNWVDADFSGLKDLKDKFSSSNIKNCKFVNSDLSELTLKSNCIDICDFSNSNLRNSIIQNSSLSKNIFTESSLIDSKFTGSEVNICDFTNANFSGTEFLNTNFQNNKIEGAIWKHTSFKNTSLIEINFDGIMEDCSFENCGFGKVKFQNATILNTFFKHNRKFNKVEFLDCKVDKLTFAFLKSNGATLEGITIIQEQNTDTN
jgi:uncharacterized protein YjbI with pentapeptide repeats